MSNILCKKFKLTSPLTFRKMLVSTKDTRMRASMNVAVVGGGAAGLIACRELLREGHKVTVFEKSDTLGGVWLYTDDIDEDKLGLNPQRAQVHSSMYRGLRTNLPREIMGLSDFPFTTNFQGSIDPRQFPCHQEVLAYIAAIAEEYNLRPHIKFGTEVIRATPIDMHDWELTTRSVYTTDFETGQYDAVVVCNGHFSKPKVPSIPGQRDFSGKQIHSHNYRTPESFVGKRVLLIGAQSSGADIALELATVASHEFLCSATFVGTPFEHTLSLGGGKVDCRMLPKTINDDGGSIVLTDGTTVENIDCIIYCTGYHYNFPFLEDVGALRVHEGAVVPLYKHMFPLGLAPRLSFIGIPWKTIPFPQFELQGKLIAQVLSGKVKLPSVEMMSEDTHNHLNASAVATALKDLKDGQRWLEGDTHDETLALEGLFQQKEAPEWSKIVKLKPRALRYIHNMSGSLQWEYNNWMIKMMDCEMDSWPQWRCQLYDDTGKSRRQNIETYRDIHLPVRT